MRLLVVSDLHAESASYEVPADLHYDAVVLAGDIHSPGRRAIRWALETFAAEAPIVFVPGNHEYYDSVLESELAAMRTAAAGTRLHILDRDAVVLADCEGRQVRFLGCTLWTDFELPVAEGSRAVSDVDKAIREAELYVYDFRLIKTGVESPRQFTPTDALARHQQDRAWLLQELSVPCEVPTVVVTHHAPSPLSTHQRFRANWINPSYISDLPKELFEAGAALWIHGHTHDSFDYTVGATRVVCNPRGYRKPDSSFENALFQPGFVVDVSVAR